MRASSPRSGAAAALLAAAAAVLWSPSVRALDTVWSTDQQANARRLKGLAAPGAGADALRLQDVAVGNCSIWSSASGYPATFSCLGYADPFAVVSSNLTLKTDGTLHLIGGQLSVVSAGPGTGAATSLLGVTGGSPATRADIACSGDGQVFWDNAGAVGCASLPFSKLSGSPPAVTSLTGEVTGTGPGATATTITANAVTLPKLQTVTGLSVLGVPGSSTANVSAITATSNGQVMQMFGGTLQFHTFDFSQLTGAPSPDGTSIGLAGSTYQRLALTGAVTAAAGSGTTAFGAAAARSVLVNATNASAVPAYLGGGTAGQALMVNGAGTGLAWQLVPSGSLSGTANTVPYFDAGGAMAEASNALGYDPANVRFGSRVPSGLPLYQLHLVDESLAADRGLDVASYNNGTSGPLVTFQAAKGTYGSPAVVDSTKYGGRLRWDFWDGGQWLHTVSLGTHTVFGSTPTSGSVPSEIYALVNTGNVPDSYVSSTARIPLRITPSAAPGAATVLIGSQVRTVPTGTIVPNLAVFGTSVFGADVITAGATPTGLAGTEFFTSIGFPGPLSELRHADKFSGSASVPMNIEGIERWHGWDGTTFVRSTAVAGWVDSGATVTTGSVPGSWGVFHVDETTAPLLYSGSAGDVATGFWDNQFPSTTGGFLRIQGVSGPQTGVPAAIAYGLTTMHNTPLSMDITDDRLYAWFTTGSNHWAPIAQDTTAMSSGFLRNTTGTGVWSVDTTSYTPATRTVQGTTPILIAGGTSAVDLSANRVWSLATNGVTDALFRQSGPLSLVGRSANSTGNTGDVSATAASDCAFRESGSTLGCGTLATAAYANNSVTLGKVQQIPGGTFLGNSGGTTSNVATNTFLAPFTFTTGNLGILRDNTTIVVNGSNQLAVGAIPESSVTNLTTDLAGKQATGNYITATTGDVVATGPGSVSATIQSHVVSYAKMQQGAGLSVLGVTGASTANLADITATGGTQCLQTNGAGTAVVWAACPTSGGGGTITGVTATAPVVSSGGTAPNITLGTDATLAVVSSLLGRAAVSGDVSIPAGVNVATLLDVPNATPVLGSELFTNVPAPATPASGKSSCFVDSTSLNYTCENASGTFTNMVIPGPVPTNHFMTGVSATGVVASAQPTETDVLNLVTDLAGKQNVVTWPASPRVLISGGVSSSPVGDSTFTFDTGTHKLTVSGGSVLGGSVVFSGAAGAGENLLGVGNTGAYEIVFPFNGISLSGGALGGLPFGASGGSHAIGMVPDPGGTTGTTKVLYEDATWKTPDFSVGHYFAINFDGITTNAWLIPGSNIPTQQSPSAPPETQLPFQVAHVRLLVHNLASAPNSGCNVGFAISQNGSVVVASAVNVTNTTVSNTFQDTGRIAVSTSASDSWGVQLSTAPSNRTGCSFSNYVTAFLYAD